MTQSTIDSLYAKLNYIGEWNSYYLLNDAVNFEFVSRNGGIDSLYFKEDSLLKPWVLPRLFRPILGQKTSHQALKNMENIKDAYAFIDNRSSLTFARYSKNKVAAVMEIKPQFKSQIGGIIGSTKDEKGEWVTTGEIDLHLENTRKQGSLIDLKWSQPNPKSRTLFFAIETPLTFGFPFGNLIIYKQDFLEESFILESRSGLITGLGPFGRWSMGGKREVGKDLNIDYQFESDAIIFGIKGDRRNNRWMPSKGKFWFFNFSLGKVTDNKGYRQVIEADFKLDQYQNQKWGAYRFLVHGGYVSIDGRELPKSKKVKLGGANTIRGYFDNQFSVDWFIIHTIEWLMGDLNNSQLFLFIDSPLAYEGLGDTFTSPQTIKLKSGYGVGFRQYTGRFTMDISVGFSKTSPGGKLHLKFASDL